MAETWSYQVYLGSDAEQSRLHTYHKIIERLIHKLQDKPSEKILAIDVTSFEQLRFEYEYRHPFEVDCRIDDLILRTADKFPNRNAIAAWNGTVRYGKLKNITASWALQLRSDGDKKGSSVIHFLDHSKWAILAWIAILRAGYVCVPVDIKTPIGRVKDIVEQTNATLAICDNEKALGRIVNKVWTPSTLGEGKVSADLRDFSISPEDVATIIFTSGSTGKPKGVVQFHAAISRSLQLVSEAFKLNKKTRFLQFASHSFDASLCELLAPLVCGGCVCVPSYTDALINLNENLNRFTITDAYMSPTMARLLDDKILKTLKKLYLGGEAPTNDICRKWSKRLELRILYGTTETGVWDSFVLHSKEIDAKNVGYPISGRLWVVSPHTWGHLSPMGVPGELCVEGPDVARGYLRLEKESRQRFKNDVPWLQKEGSDNDSLVFRTGDLARYLDDGSIELLGRIDTQIKINGQRIEPGEIESRMNSSLSRSESVFVVAACICRSQKLCAIISHNEDDTPRIDRSPLSEEVQQRILNVDLPSYMIPTKLYSITSTPLTRTGKADRRQLKALLEKFEREKFESRFYDESGSACQDRNGGEGPNQSNVIQNDDSSSKRILDVICAYISETKGIRLSRGSIEKLVLGDIGVDSIEAASLANRLRVVTGKPVPANFFHKKQIAIGDLAKTIRGDRKDSSENGVKYGDPNFMESVSSWKQKLTQVNSLHVLITGGTGYLGSRIVQELLDSDAEIYLYLLVRAKDIEKCWQRIEESFGKRSWWKESYRAYLTPLAGDLEREYLGLEEAMWKRLFGGFDNEKSLLDIVIHNGAVVDWLASYGSLQAANVGSTFKLLRGLRQSKRPPRMLYISGGYFTFRDESIEQSAEKADSMTGYEQTKLAGELIIDHYNHSFAQNDPHRQVLVLKAGYIIGSPGDDETQVSDALWRFVKACLRVGAYSETDAQGWVPVASRATIAQIVLEMTTNNHNQRRPGCWYTKMTDGVQLEVVWSLLFETIGERIRSLPHDEWLERILESIEKDGKEHPLYALQDWIKEFEGKFGELEIGDAHDQIRSDVSKDAIRESLRYLHRIGFFKRKE